MKRLQTLEIVLACLICLIAGFFIGVIIWINLDPEVAHLLEFAGQPGLIQQDQVVPRRTAILVKKGTYGEILHEFEYTNLSSVDGSVTVLPSVLKQETMLLYGSSTSLAVKFKNDNGVLYYKNTGEDWRTVGSGGGLACALKGDGTHDLATITLEEVTALDSPEITMLVITKLNTLSAVSNFYEERTIGYDCIKHQFLVDATGYLQYIRGSGGATCQTYTIADSVALPNITSHPVAIGVAYRNHSAMFFVDGSWGAWQGYTNMTTEFPVYSSVGSENLTVTLGKGFPNNERIYTFMRGNTIPFQESSFMLPPVEGQSQWPGFTQGYFMNEQDGNDIHDTLGTFDLQKGDTGIEWYYDLYGY